MGGNPNTSPTQGQGERYGAGYHWRHQQETRNLAFRCLTEEALNEKKTVA